MNRMPTRSTWEAIEGLHVRKCRMQVRMQGAKYDDRADLDVPTTESRLEPRHARTARAGDDTRKRRRAPSATPGGTDTRHRMVKTALAACPSRRRRARSRSRRGRRSARRCRASAHRAARRRPPTASRRDRRSSACSTASRRCTLAEKGVAHALDDGPDARKVDGDLVGKAVVGHRSSGNDRDRLTPCQATGARLRCQC